MSQDKEEDFLKQSQQFWSEQYGREISIEETEEIIRNITGFFELLMKWDNEDKQKQTKDELDQI